VVNGGGLFLKDLNIGQYQSGSNEISDPVVLWMGIL
jgi:hypothetical protein